MREQSWHSRLYAQAYLDFSVPAPVAAGTAYWTAVLGHAIYRGCLFVFWITLNVFTLPFGVFVEPLWRPKPKFRRLQFPGRIPVIAVALPILAAYASYRTSAIYGAWHIALPLVAVAVGSTVSVALLAAFNLLQKKTEIPEPDARKTLGPAV